MAFSGSQKTRLGLIAIPRAVQSFLAKASAEYPNKTFAVASLMVGTFGDESPIIERGLGVNSAMAATQGYNSAMTADGQGVESPINKITFGVDGSI